MSNGDEMKDTNSGNDVVRLKVEGATAAVNTLRDHHTVRGMSLVCPFPALEVDIPIRFGKAEDAMAQGTIHRIGVEDDPESGLPRLRLSVRVREPHHARAGRQRADRSRRPVRGRVRGNSSR